LDAAPEELQNALDVLSSSVGRLAGLVEQLSGDELRRPAYPSKWTIADVLSHLGSGATITEERLHAAVSGTEPDMAAMQATWDEWNAKTPEQQASDALAADRSMLESLVALSAEDRARARFAMGSLQLDIAGFLALRVNEHVVHTWDIAVVFDRTAPIPYEAVPSVLAGLGMIAGFVGKPTGTSRTINVRTTAPTRSYAVVLGSSSVSIAESTTATTSGLEMPAEALIRLVYGRLDPAHTPPVHGEPADLEQLRRAFPGF